MTDLIDRWGSLGDMRWGFDDCIPLVADEIVRLGGPDAIAHLRAADGGMAGYRSQQERDDFVAQQGKTMIRWLCSFDTKRGRAGWRGLDILHFDDAGKITTKLTYAKAKVLKLDAMES